MKYKVIVSKSDTTKVFSVDVYNKDALETLKAEISFDLDKGTAEWYSLNGDSYYINHPRHKVAINWDGKQPTHIKYYMRYVLRGCDLPSVLKYALKAYLKYLKYSPKGYCLHLREEIPERVQIKNLAKVRRGIEQKIREERNKAKRALNKVGRLSAKLLTL